MPEMTTAEGTEPVTEETQHTEAQQLPDDHPLVKTLAAQKAQLRELKAKASRLDEIEEAQKSEAEKIADRLAKADAEVASVPAKVCEVIKPYLIQLNPEIDSEKAELLLTATEPELLMQQWAQLVELSGKRGRNIVPREGRTPNPAPADPSREFLRALNGQS